MPPLTGPGRCRAEDFRRCCPATKITAAFEKPARQPSSEAHHRLLDPFLGAAAAVLAASLVEFIRSLYHRCDAPRVSPVPHRPRPGRFQHPDAQGGARTDCASVPAL